MNRRGAIETIASNVAVMLFAALLMVALFTLFSAQMEMNKIDETMQAARNIARAIDAVYASPENTQVTISFPSKFSPEVHPVQPLGGYVEIKDGDRTGAAAFYGEASGGTLSGGSATLRREADRVEVT